MAQQNLPGAYRGVGRTAPSGVNPGQVVAEVTTEEAVLFVIGMRINRLRDVRGWWGAFVGMPRMLRELQQHPEDGLLAAHSYWAGRDFLVLQYWESAEKLGRYAKATDRAHAPAWAAFNKAAARRGSVGLFHETYVVPRDQIETRYANMPAFGLAKAHGHADRFEHRRRHATQNTAERRLEVTEPA